MAIKHLVTRGFATSPGGISFTVTFGFISAIVSTVVSAVYEKIGVQVGVGL